MLLAVPNVSEGRDRRVIETIGEAFGARARLLDVHSDPDHNRTVYTLAGVPGQLAGAVAEGASKTLELIEIRAHQGIHPRVGAIDVAPIVHRSDSQRGAASAEALVLADLLGHELALPVFLYGTLGGGRTRAEVRRGGPAALAVRLREGELSPDFGPSRLHPTAGAVLVSARAPLVAFNVDLTTTATLQDAKDIARRIREGGPEGLPGVRAIGLWLEQQGRAQVSTNVEDHFAASLASVVRAVARHAEPESAELVGLAPEAALAGFPGDLPLRNRATIEQALAETS